jgi:LCP family protein required for cell wall assembly
MAAFLSFLWPGLGQWYVGRRRAAFTYALPFTVVALVLLVEALGGADRLFLRLLDPSVALTSLILVGLLAAWRLLSMADAAIVSGGRVALRRPRTAAAFAAMVVVVVIAHALAAFLAWSFYSSGTEIFVADQGPDVPAPTPAPSVNGGPPPTPNPTPPTVVDRVNVLLTGIDSSPSRDHALTDTLIVASIDPRTREVAMISFPRDIAYFPLRNGSTYGDRINSLMTYAEENPERYPAGGLGTLTDELGHLLGVPIHYYAAVNLRGFERMIDEVGGVTIDNEREIDDPAYGGWRDGRIGFHLSEGRHTLDGPTALAYVRSRKGIGDSDFTRARRQQQLLVALEEKMSEPSMMLRLPAILDAAGETIKTNFPPERLTEMLDLSRTIDADDVQQFVLGPPYSETLPLSETDGRYLLELDLEQLADLSVELFGSDSRYYADANGEETTP